MRERSVVEERSDEEVVGKNLYSCEVYQQLWNNIGCQRN